MASLKGLGLFTLQVTALISAGMKETIDEIERHFDNCDLVEYLSNKYSDMFYIDFDNTLYSNKAINKYFSNYSSYIIGNERKYGIANEEDGLLLIIALVTDKIETECVSWNIEL